MFQRKIISLSIFAMCLPCLISGCAVQNETVSDANADITPTKQIVESGNVDGLEKADLMKWVNKEIEIDSKRLVLKDKKIRLFKGDDLFWETEDEILVQDVLWFNIDEPHIKYDSNEMKLKDGVLPTEKELVILCWKKGRYGKYTPTWMEEDPEKDIWSQHIFVYNIVDDKVRARWMSSYIGKDVETMVNQEHFLILTSPEGDIATWKWNHWGFERIKEQ